MVDPGRHEGLSFWLLPRWFTLHDNEMIHTAVLHLSVEGGECCVGNEDRHDYPRVAP